MSISDRLDQIERDANGAAWPLVLGDDVPALLAALRAVLDVCETYPVPPRDEDVTGDVLAGMEKLERLVRAAIHDALGEA